MAQGPEQARSSARRRDPGAFRPDPVAPADSRPTRVQSIALLGVLVLVAACVSAAALLVRPDRARSFALFDGSLFLADSVAPVALDLASGRPTVRLVDANALVGAGRAQDLGVVPLQDSTLLLNQSTGEFNVVDPTGFVVKSDGGVPIPGRAGGTTAVGTAAQDFAYVRQSGPGGTSVYLVGATTVQAAAAGTQTVTPRAFRTMTQATATVAGTTVSVGNDLWMLAGTSATRIVRHLALPPDSRTGVRLLSTDLGQVSGPAAFTADGPGADATVVLASAGRVRLFRDGAQVADVPFTAPAGVDRVLAATGGPLSFLLHGTAGWSLLRVGSDAGVKAPLPLTSIAADAALVPPAAGGDELYTMDAAGGQMLTISAAGTVSALPGVDRYPLATRGGRTIETGGFDDATIVSRGPRVVLNSPRHLNAVVVFTDGSHAPLVVEKSSAATVNAAGGAEALTRSRTGPKNPVPPRAGAPTPVGRPATPVNNRIDCATTSQTPHIPALGQPVPGSRSVLLQWDYPITAQTDCVPQTYTIEVAALSGDAPAPPAQVRVDGQRSVNLTGLFPSTSYQISVTAYINGRGTRSAPIRITTGPEGPAAPRAVTVSTDTAGSWRLSWSSCGTQAQGCVPSRSWRVVPQFCDARGLSGAPAPLDVRADPTTAAQPGAVLPAGPDLLGRALSFTIEGIGEQGQIGTPSAATACTTSWSAPVLASMSLSASTPRTVSVGATASTVLALDLGADPVRDVGGVGAAITLRLDGPGGLRTRTIAWDGVSSRVTAAFGAVAAGSSYRADATVAAPGRPATAVTLVPVAITVRYDWPTLGVDTQCPPDDASGLSCTLRVRITGISSAQVGGESFDLTDDSRLQCSSISRPLARSSFDPATATVILTGVSQLQQYFGSCSVTVGLKESASGTGGAAYFGGTESARRTVGIDLGSPVTAGVAAGELDARWSAQNGASAQLTYTGSKDLAALTTGWAETLRAPDGTRCGDAGDRPGTTPDSAAYVVATQSCVDRFGDQSTGWTLQVSYAERTTRATRSIEVALAAGPPPSYRPCAPTGAVASWGATRADGVTVTVAGVLGGCSGWTFVLHSSTGTQCGTGTAAPDAAGTVQLPLSCGDPADTSWTVTVGWTRPDGSTGGIANVTPITGSPPTS